jgi:hypothetical protein
VGLCVFHELHLAPGLRDEPAAAIDCSVVRQVERTPDPIARDGVRYAWDILHDDAA